MRKRRIGKAKSAAMAARAVLPDRSRRCYVRIAPQHLAYLKFVLEAYDNLAYFSVVDKTSAVAQFIYPPGRQREAREFLDGMAAELDFTVFELDRNGK